MAVWPQSSYSLPLTALLLVMAEKAVQWAGKDHGRLHISLPWWRKGLSWRLINVNYSSLTWAEDAAQAARRGLGDCEREIMDRAFSFYSLLQFVCYYFWSFSESKRIESAVPHQWREVFACIFISGHQFALVHIVFFSLSIFLPVVCLQLCLTRLSIKQVQQECVGACVSETQNEMI